MGCLHLKLVPNISLAGSVFNVFWYCLSAMICLKKDGCFCDPPCKRKHLHRCPTHKLSCNIPSLVALFVPLQDGIYTLPCHLSMQARDLITRILKTDPLRRTTISEIRCHPWFQVHLPLYLAVPPPEYAQQLKRVLLFSSSTDLHPLIRIGLVFALACLWTFEHLHSSLEHAWNCGR
jgi:serine/threonine protein kinase